jgi:hypothetical protein
LSVFSQYLFQQPARTHWFIMDLGFCVGVFFSADTAEKLVQIMDNSHKVDLPGRVSNFNFC